MKRILPILALILLVSVAFNFVRTVRKLSGVGREMQQLRDEVTSLERERQELLAKKAEAQTPEFVEKEVREKLGLAREGETILILPKQGEDLRLKTRNLRGTEKLENWQRWAVVFGFEN